MPIITMSNVPEIVEGSAGTTLATGVNVAAIVVEITSVEEKKMFS